MSIRPLPLVAAAYALGILAADQHAPLHPVPVGAAVAAALLLAGRPRRLVGLRPLGRALVVLLAVASTGHFALSLRLASAARSLPDGEAVCGGVVSSTRATTGGRTEWRIRRAHCRLEADSLRIGVIAFIDTQPPEVGDLVSVRGELRAPSGARNPGDVDRRRAAARQGYSAVLHTSAGSAPRVLRHARWPGRSIAATRAVLRDRVRVRYAAEVEPLVRALLLGDTSGVTATDRDHFRRAGLAHLLAVSGLHVGLLAGVVLLVVSSVLARVGLPAVGRSVITALAVLAILAGLAALVGPRPSVLRAALMGALVAARRLLQRAGPAVRDVLALAMVIQLAVDPSALFQPGFQLSHAAVSGLAILPRSRTWILSGLLASAAATVATAPFVAHHFGPVPLAGMITNLVGVPLTAVVVTSGMLGLLPRAGPITSASEVAARLLLKVAALGADTLGWMRFVVPDGRLPTVLLTAVGASFLARSRRGRLVAAAVALVVALFPAGPRLLRLVFLDVGQGDAAVLHLPDGRTALVDTGSSFGSAPSRYLARAGIGRVDHLVITHEHADHAGGVENLFESVSVGRVIAPVPLGRRVGRLAAGGDTLDLGPDLRVYVLAPAEPGRGNDASLALLVQYGTTRMLLLGDAEEPAERRLVATWPGLLRSDVVKVGHHGSRTSSSRGLVLRAASDGTLAVVSVGRTNRYGHPDAAILGRWAGAGARIWDTSLRGAACVTSNGQSVAVGCP